MTEPSSKYNILMHARLLPALKDQGRLLRGQLQRTMQNLKEGNWGGGTRVKILKGIKKAVFEARVNDDMRLLFTVASSKASTPPYNFCQNILCWDLVDHDHLDRARRMNTVPEAGFLDFEELASCEISDPPSHAEAPVGTNEDDLLDFVSAPKQKTNAEDELIEPIRWYVIQPEIIFNDAEWQRLVDEDLSDLELKLSGKQAEIVYSQGPSLIRGTAGSGKTTVTVYRMARALTENPACRILYLTYSEALLNSVKRLFKDLFTARGLALPENMPVFKTFPQLCSEIAGIQNPVTARPLRFPAFEEWFNRIYREGSPTLAWEEIRGIIKGACLNTHSKALTLTEYEKLGRKRAPLFIKLRPELFRIYESYQKWSDSHSRLDDIDLAREALKARNGSKKEVFDLVICDEGQDLTEVELRLLINLPSRPEGLFFTADQQQVVNPSGFRWAELKTHLQKNLPEGWRLPEIHTLDRNYRSVQSIVALSNALIKLKRDRTGRSDDDFFQESTVKGATPVIINTTEENIIRQVQSLGPGCAVITATSKQATRLRRLTSSERIFDIPESKGLEFETCLLWDVAAADSNVWRELINGEENLRGDAATRRVLHHAYVAVTRARRNLMIFESTEKNRHYWQSEHFRLCTEEDGADIVGRIMNTPASREDWLREALYYFERNRFRQASECYRRAGDDFKAEESLAHFYRYIEDFATASKIFTSLEQFAEAALCHELNGQHQLAAELYIKDKRHADAARCYENSGDFRLAAEHFRRSGEEENYRRCQLQYFITTRLWVDAAAFALKCGLREESLLYYTRAGKKQKVFELKLQFAQEEGNFKKAGDLLLSKNKFKKAADMYDQGGHDQEAGTCRALMAEASGQWQSAADKWQSIGNRHSQLTCQAKAYLKDKNHFEAAICYDELADDQKLFETLERGSKGPCEAWLRALFCSQEGEFLDAALAFEEAGLLQKSYDLYELYDNGEFGELNESDTERFEEIQSRRLIREALELANEHAILTAAEVSEEYATIRLAAEALEDLGSWPEAGKLYQRIHEDEKALRSYEKIKNKPQAYYDLLKEVTGEEQIETSEVWEGKQLSQKLFSIKAKSYEDVGEYLKAAEIYYEAGMTKDGNRCMSMAGMDLSDTQINIPTVPLFPTKRNQIWDEDN